MLTEMFQKMGPGLTGLQGWAHPGRGRGNKQKASGAVSSAALNLQPLLFCCLFVLPSGQASGPHPQPSFSPRPQGSKPGLTSAFYSICPSNLLSMIVRLALG